MIHKEQQRVNGCLSQLSAVSEAPNNYRVSGPSSSSSSSPPLTPRKDSYYNSSPEQAFFAKVSRQNPFSKPLKSSRSLKDSAECSHAVIPSDLALHIHLQSDTMDLAHSSSLEALASVATANAAVRHSLREYPPTSSTFTERPLEAPLPPYSERGPRAHSIQEQQHQTAASEDLDSSTNPDSRRSSDISGTMRAEPCVRDTTSTAEDGPSCSYSSGCTTGSPLRKVISHVFGRNKLCTKQIPEGVWVHYCRKHYQRSRYRNPSGFALLQCDLVRKHIDFLEMSVGVSNWIIKFRKREEQRLNKENAELAADRVTEDAASDGEDDMDVVETSKQRSPTSKNRLSSTSVSKARGRPATAASVTSCRWLTRFIGYAKTTPEVLEALDTIETKIRDTKCNFPDIEFLPNVSRSGRGSDHQRTPSSGSSSSLSSSAHPNHGVDHHKAQGPKHISTLSAQNSPAKSPSKRRKLRRDTRPSLTDGSDE